MDSLKSLFSLLGISRPPVPRPSALESSALNKLSLDLIVHITRFLPPDSAASFSLCCRPIYFALGNQHFKALKENACQDLFRFLTLLERDLPGHIVCHPCNKLHAISKADRYFTWKISNSDTVHDMKCCGSEHYSVTTWYFPGRCFSVVLAMTMKTYRQGRDCSTLLELLSYSRESRYVDGCRVECRTIEPQIVDSSLLLRECRIYTIRQSEKTPGSWDVVYTICPHIPKVPIRFDGHCFRVDYSFLAGCGIYCIVDGMIQCNRCHTEFYMEFQTIGGWGTALFVIIWKDLGQGRSPLDPMWQRHIRHKNPQPPIPFLRGSIFAAFKRGDAL